MTAIGLVREGKYVGVRELRENLSRMIKSQGAFFVTEHGKPVKAMIPYGTLLELLDLLEELKDKTLIQEIAEARREYRKGGWIPVERLKKRLQEL